MRSYAGNAPLLIAFFCGCAAFGPGGAARLDKVEMPEGFHISFYAQNVPGARSLAISPSGIVFVGTIKEGRVYALVDTNRDQKADEVLTIARGLSAPNGVAWHDGNLYVVEDARILCYTGIEDDLEHPPEPGVIFADFPAGGEHFWKHLAIGPDGMLYVSVGSPFNVGVPDDDRYATIMRLGLDGSGAEVFARGVRNSMGFDWHPLTREMWFTDNGRDWLGDNLPPDELNHAPQPGLHFGWPYCFGQNQPDPKFGKGIDLSRFTPDALDLPAHVAALGMRFYTGTMFPPEYRNQVFVAEHGSWNRTAPIGYRISLARFATNGDVSYDVFARGWLEGSTAWGRPVDVLVMPDGALLISDDKAGAVYRVSYAE